MTQNLLCAVLIEHFRVYKEFSACPSFRSRFDLDSEVTDERQWELSLGLYVPMKTVTSSSNRILASRKLTKIMLIYAFLVFAKFQSQKVKVSFLTQMPWKPFRNRDQNQTFWFSVEIIIPQDMANWFPVLELAKEGESCGRKWHQLKDHPRSLINTLYLPPVGQNSKIKW